MHGHYLGTATSRCGQLKRLTILMNNIFIPLAIVNSQKLPLRFYDTKKCVLFLKVYWQHNEKAIKQSQNMEDLK